MVEVGWQKDGRPALFKEGILLQMQPVTRKRMVNTPTELQDLGRWCPRIIQSPGRPGMPATWSDDFQRSHPSKPSESSIKPGAIQTLL